MLNCQCHVAAALVRYITKEARADHLLVDGYHHGTMLFNGRLESNMCQVVIECSLQLGGLENGRKTQTTPRPAPFTSLYLPTLLGSFLGWDAEFFCPYLHVPVYRPAALGPAEGLPVLEAASYHRSA
ncbi:hypothetical protein MC885_017369, partial [Smutsia gigantea]